MTQDELKFLVGTPQWGEIEKDLRRKIEAGKIRLLSESLKEDNTLSDAAFRGLIIKIAVRIKVLEEMLALPNSLSGPNQN